MFTHSIIQSFIIAVNHELWVSNFKEEPVKFKNQTREESKVLFSTPFILKPNKNMNLCNFVVLL